MHTLTQFVLLFILVIRDKAILNLAPPFLLLSLFTGAFVGWLVIKSREAIVQMGAEWEEERDD